MRIPCLALLVLVLALPYSPASAQALPLSDSLVVGFWDFNTDEIPRTDSSDPDLRSAGFFTGQHTFEHTIWSKDDGYPDSTMVYTGIRMTGTWFIRDTLLGTIYHTCVGFTEAGRRECAIDTHELGDTDYVTLENMELRGFGRSRVMRLTTENWELPIWRYEGPVADMGDPAFWEGATLSLRPYRHSLPASGSGTPVFDALGRLPSGKVPVRLYQGKTVPSRAAR